MSLLFDAAADRILRTTDLLDYANHYTWMAWFRPTAVSGTRTLFSLNDNSTKYDFWGLISGLTLYVETETGGESRGTLPAADDWYHIAVTRSGGTSTELRYFVDGVQNGATFGADPAGRGAGTRMEMGGFTSGNSNPFQGKIAYIKAWSAGLSESQIATEMNSIAAVVTSNLYGEWHTESASRFADSSGNGRDWTEAGSVAYDSDFPFTEGSAGVALYRRIIEGDR